ncbi:hypothetical protein PM082_013667 [Marasmius tenuissimus]|nr:hypothetical protein PM082_013667 [Marasmius tenuissimus]
MFYLYLPNSNPCLPRFDSKPLDSISKGLFQNHVHSTVTPATITRFGDRYVCAVSTVIDIIVFFLSVSIHALPLNVCGTSLLSSFVTLFWY